MALTNKTRRELQSKFAKEYTKKFNHKVIPELQKDVRVDTGELRDSIESREDSLRDGTPVVRTVFQKEYAAILEYRTGIFKDGSRYGESLSSNYDQYAKFALD